MKLALLGMLLFTCISCANGGWHHPNSFWAADSANHAGQAAAAAAQAGAAHIHHHTPAPSPSPGGF